MFLSRRPRSTVVARFVSSYWYCEFDVTHSEEVVFPSAQGQIIIGLHPDVSELGVLVGPSTLPTAIDPTQQRRAIGVNLHIGAASLLCRENALNLVNRQVDLEALWGSEAASLTDRVRNIDNPDLLFDELDVAILRRLSGVQPIDPNIMAAEEAIRLGVPAGQVPALLHADRRRLARSFSQSVGLGLKSYSRLCRFRTAVSELRGPSPDSLSMTAASLGYADQAHLTREVKEFSGVTPGALRSQPSSSPNHLVS